MAGLTGSSSISQVLTHGGRERAARLEVAFPGKCRGGHGGVGGGGKKVSPVNTFNGMHARLDFTVKEK